MIVAQIDHWYTSSVIIARYGFSHWGSESLDWGYAFCHSHYPKSKRKFRRESKISGYNRSTKETR